MKRLIATAMIASALLLAGCATTETTAPETSGMEPVTAGQTAQPLIKCSTCGVEFTNIKQLQQHMIKFPKHKIVPMQ